MPWSSSKFTRIKIIISCLPVISSISRIFVKRKNHRRRIKMHSQLIICIMLTDKHLRNRRSYIIKFHPCLQQQLTCRIQTCTIAKINVILIGSVEIISSIDQPGNILTHAIRRPVISKWGTIIDSARCFREMPYTTITAAPNTTRVLLIITTKVAVIHV